MAKNPSSENHYVLRSDGRIFDLLDFDTEIEVTVTQLCEGEKTILQCANEPTKLFSEVKGLRKTGEMSPFGPTNWSKLFLVRGEYEYFLAFVVIDNEKILTAVSTTGIFWNFNVNDA